MEAASRFSTVSPWACLGLIVMLLGTGVRGQEHNAGTSTATPASNGRLLVVDAEQGRKDATGSATDPFSEIAQAAAVAQPGDRVVIAGGVYDEKVSITQSGTPASPIVFTAAPGERVIVQGEGIWLAADHIILENLTLEDAGDEDGGAILITRGTGIQLRNVSAINNDGAGVRIKPTDGPVSEVRISGGEFRGNDKAGIAATGQDRLTAITIEGVIAEENTSDGLQIERASTVSIINVMTERNGIDDERNGIFLKRVNDARVTGAWTSENGHNGIALRQSESVTIDHSISTRNRHHGFDSIENCRNIRFINNVAYQNGDEAEDKGLYITATIGVTILNTILAENAGDQLAFSREGGPLGGIQSDHNLFWREDGNRLIRWDDQYFADLSAYQAESGFDRHSLMTPPGFMNPDQGDFRLRPDSPALDSGVVVPGITDDAAGQAPDIGALEHRLNGTRLNTV